MSDFSMLGIFTSMFFVILIPILSFIIFMIAVGWKINEKAGQPGWASLIPIYGTVVSLMIVKRPIWWIFLYLIPGVNLIIAIIVTIELGKSFGKDIVWSVVLLLLVPIIGYTILAFGRDEYVPIERDGD